jgi:hypothetical protein
MKRWEIADDGRWHYRGTSDAGQMQWVKVAARTYDGRLFLNTYTIPAALYRAMTLGRLA